MCTLVVREDSYKAMTGHSSDNEDAPDAASEKAGDEEKNVGESATEVKGPDTKSQSNGDVVTTQPKATQLRDWHDGLCSCHRDIGNCEFPLRPLSEVLRNSLKYRIKPTFNS